MSSSDSDLPQALLTTPHEDSLSLCGSRCKDTSYLQETSSFLPEFESDTDAEEV